MQQHTLPSTTSTNRTTPSVPTAAARHKVHTVDAINYLWGSMQHIKASTLQDMSINVQLLHIDLVILCYDLQK